MNVKRGALCVFTKSPVAGKVKTRLVPALGINEATALYKSLIIRTLETALESSIHQVKLYCSPTIEHPDLQHYSEEYNVQLYIQTGNDLGEKMHRALDHELKEFDYAIVLGCDCPWLKPEDIDEACLQLENGVKTVIGPAQDGGYYLLGLRDSSRWLFSTMPWGTPKVLQETRARLSKRNIKWSELTEYSDLDVAEDLADYESLLNRTD